MDVKSKSKKMKQDQERKARAQRRQSPPIVTDVNEEIIESHESHQDVTKEIRIVSPANPEYTNI